MRCGRPCYPIGVDGLGSVRPDLQRRPCDKQAVLAVEHAHRLAQEGALVLQAVGLVDDDVPGGRQGGKGVDGQECQSTAVPSGRPVQNGPQNARCDMSEPF